MFYRILSTLIFSPCVTIMNSLVGTKRVCNCDSFQLGIRPGETINATLTPIDGIQKQDSETGHVEDLRFDEDNWREQLRHEAPVLLDRLHDCYSNHLLHPFQVHTSPQGLSKRTKCGCTPSLQMYT